MPTTADYINQLKTDKQNLVNNLTAKGIEASSEETFTSLVPKVLNIQTADSLPKITDGRHLFTDNARTDYLEELLNLCENISNAIRMFYCCTNLTSLDLSNLDTSNVSDMNYMFYQCRNLSSLNVSNFDTSNVTNMQSMFNYCDKLTSIDVSSFNTSNVTTVTSMFYYCTGLTSLDLSNFDFSKVTSVAQVLSQMTNLTNLISFKNLGKGYTQKTKNYSSYKLDLSTTNKLTHDSLMSVINNLYNLNLTYSSGTVYTQSLVLGSTNKAKLTSDEIAIATSKGWTVS